MTGGRYTRTVKGRLTLMLAATSILVLLPVVAASIHIGRLVGLNRQLAGVERALRTQAGSAACHESHAELAQLRARMSHLGDRAFRDVVTLAALSLVALAVLTLALPERLLRTLKRLRAIVRQAEGGNLNVSLDQVSADEIGDLALDLRRVLQELGRFDELKRARICSLAAQRNSLLELLGSPAAVVDMEGRALRLSERFCEVFGVQAEALMERPFLPSMGWQDGVLQGSLSWASRDAPPIEAELGGNRYRVTVHSCRGSEPALGCLVLIFRREQAAAEAAS